ncbi:MG2 domain-containing protein [Lysobacter sp. KIS68-7]|uniref:alpha-2-macroglobulin family protein n=1 Tax=Lysobacter sp. KIS68-7 TaxID=2904252 RepID=UPI001E288B6D|nr:MG2 domain-containing protein [Lysobacter sp. KIS68-7]UHQ20348.1 MG2 domain-containing protein [Lysobacter sp. KIS68-7]
MRRCIVGVVLLGVAGFASAGDAPEARFQNDQLRIRFPVAMQVMGNERLDSRVQITPETSKRTCSWTDDTEISCSFEKTLPLATRYRIALAPELLKAATGTSLPAPSLIADTDRPTLDASVDWSAVHPRVMVASPHRVTEEALRAALRVTVDGKPQAYELTQRTRGYSREASRFMLEVPASPREAVLEVRIVPGLRSEDGPLPGTQDEALARVVIGEPFQVRGIMCAGSEAPLVSNVVDGHTRIDGCTPGEAIRLQFSQAPEQSAREAWVKEWPEGLRFRGASVSYARSDRKESDTAPLRAPGWWIEFAIDDAHAQRQFTVPAMQAAAHEVLLSPVEVAVRTGAMRPALYAPFDRALLEKGASAQVRVVNAAPQSLQLATIARDAKLATWKSPAAGDAPVDVEPDVVRKTLRDGGFVDWRAENTPGKFTSGAMAVAPDFDVYAVIGRREVVAWAHDWDSSAPIAGARAELLLRRTPDALPEGVASATTDSNGMATVELPEDFPLPDSRDARAVARWFLRVEGKVGRAVLPLAFYDWNSSLLATPAQEGFGVADRPVYRAGDTVHWRLWARQWRNGVLVPRNASAPIDLVLTNYYDKPVLTWTGTLDATGAVSGDTVLPVHLDDGDYCVREAGDKAAMRVCFFVGTFRAQDLWIRANTTARIVREGDTLPLDIEAGYYSGGTAAGAAIDNIENQLEPTPLGEAYPQWRDYTFAQARNRWDESEIAGLADRTITLDGSGRARLSLPVTFDKAAHALPPFGTIMLSAEVQLSDRDSTTSNFVKLSYARFTRYVGLKLGTQWLDDTSPVQLTGVVVDAEGREVPADTIDVDVYYAEKSDSGGGEKVHACRIAKGQATDCTFERRRTGYYRFVARSGDAAPAEPEYYVWASSGGAREDKPIELDLADQVGTAGTPLRTLVKQRKPGPVLFVFSADGRILDAAVMDLVAGTHDVELQTQPSWPRNVTLRAYVRGERQADVLPAGFRRAVPTYEKTQNVEFAASPDSRVPVSVAFAPTQSAPGAKAHLVLHNTSDSTRDVTLTVVDDALATLGAEQFENMNPRNMRAAVGTHWDSLGDSGFGGWNQDRWRWLIGKPNDPSTCTTDCVITMMGNGAINPIDVSSVDSSMPFARDTTNVALLAPGTVRRNAAAPPRQSDDFEGLDTVEVVGAAAIDPFAYDASATPHVARDESRSVDASPSRGPIRIRTQFADTALWRTDIVLAPGETRTVDFVVPDNLTRWRAVAWSDDGRGDFATADATLEAGLPVEARLQSPVRIYPGDRSRIAVNARQVAAHAAQAQATLQVDGGGTRDSHPATLALAPQGQASFGVSFAPSAPGPVLLTATASTDDGQDGVAQALEVASTAIAAQRTQAGWIGAQPLALQLPALPAGASNPYLRVSVWRGNDALVHAWTEDLRDYPHRCWEQILSRAVAAALAVQRNDSAWPDARAVVQEALDNASVFQSDDGGMRFFKTEYQEHLDISSNASLTAYTVDAFGLLRALGYAIPSGVDEDARNYLESVAKSSSDDQKNQRAIAAAVADDAADVAKLHADFATLDLPAKVAAARALARAADPQAGATIASLLDIAPKRGEARVLARSGGWSTWDRWMSSPMREQCELIRLLQDFPQYAPDGAKRALVAGLSDLYAGGVPEVDTQTGASCLRALHGEGASDASAVGVDATLGVQTEHLALRNGEVRAEAGFELPTPKATLRIAASGTLASPVAYLAHLDYNEDARQAQSTAIGFSLERRYEALRGNKWVPVAGITLKDGDWVRITLTVVNARPRRFVAVTDDLPGGLRPTDLSLAAVAGVDMEKLGDEGDWAFYERKLDPRKPRFYAEELWPGRHEIRYFTRVSNAGDYLAAPAVAELMYGEATRARTAAARIRIPDPAPVHAAP